MSQPPLPDANGIRNYIEDGARIAAILLVWGVIAAFFTYGIGDLGHPSGILASIGRHIGAVLAAVGVLNAILYVLYRSIDYWHQF